MPDDASTIWIEHSGEHNDAAVTNDNGDYVIQVVRKELAPEMTTIFRQNPDNSCQLQQSTDDGDTWTLAFDYSLCLPPAQQTILDTVINNNTWVSTFAPTVTFISQPGYTDTQKDNAYAALCYAVDALVQSMASTCYKVKQGEVTAETLTAVALGIASTILIAFNILTFGALTPVCLAIAGAALAAVAAIEALTADVWLDADNLQALKCLALGNLSNATVSLASFQQAFANADCLTSDQQGMATIFTTMLANVATAQQLYDNYLNAIGNANAAAQSGVLGASCVCDDATWCFRLTPVWPGHWEFGSQVSYCGGFYDVTGGHLQTVSGNQVWYDNHDNPAPVATNGAVAVTLGFYIPSNAVLESVEVDFDPGSANDDHTWHYLDVNGNNYCVQHRFGAPYEVSGLSISGETVDVVQTMWNNDGAQDQFVSAFILRGSGVPPFGVCDNC